MYQHHRRPIRAKSTPKHGHFVSFLRAINRVIAASSIDSNNNNSSGMSALEKLKTATKTAAALEGGASTASRDSGSRGHRGSGSSKLKSVTTQVVFINKIKALTEERRRSGGVRSSRRRAGEHRREGSTTYGSSGGRRSPTREGERHSFLLCTLYLLKISAIIYNYLYRVLKEVPVGNVPASH
jgi:hypothetical protein